MAVPSYLKDDPDFATFVELQNAAAAADEFYTSGSTASPGAQAEGTTATPSVAPSAFSLGKSKLPYHMLDEKTIALDNMLYNILRLNVKGTKCELLASVMYPSYVQGMIVLYKHMEINRNDRKTRAFSQADGLIFDGDVHLIQIKATAMFRELFASKCSIMDYALHKVMHAFDGKNESSTRSLLISTQ